MSDSADARPVSAEVASPLTGPGYRLVIFDFDGTLADTYDWFAGVINGVADRYNFKRVELDEVETVRRMSARQAIRHVGITPWKLPFISRHMRRLATRDIDSVKLFSGIEAVLIELDRRGVILAAVSSNSEANVRRVLGPLAWRFRTFACGAALFRKARRLRRVLRRCGVRPEHALAIGDEIRDLEAARKVGCDFGAVAWGYTRPDALETCGPAYLFSSPGQILRTLTETRG